MVNKLKFTRHNTYLLLIISFTAALFLYLCSQSFFVQDDAFITFRYVRNFLNGNGLVFNKGEYVEGYTSFLWVMILAITSLFKFNIQNTAQYISLFFGLATLPLTYLLSCRFNFDTVTNKQKISAITFNLIPVFLLSVTGAFSYWSVSGMETSLFVFLVLLGIYFNIENSSNDKINLKFVSTFMLASLTRPEGFFFFALILLYTFITSRQYSVKRNNTLKELYIFLIPYTLYLSLRLIYYGYPFPNTFYAKAGFTDFYFLRGIAYFTDFTAAYLLYGVMLLLPFILLRVQKVRGRISLLMIIIYIYIVSMIIIGGDVLPMHRFFLPILPLIYILFGKSLEYFYTSYNKNNLIKKNILLFIVVFIAATGFINLKNEETKLNLMYRTEIGLVAKMSVYGDWLKERQEESSRPLTVAASTIGAISYYSEMRLIDLLGLTDEYIAHNPKELTGLKEAAPSTWRERHYNADYVLDQKPDYIIFPAGAKPSGFPESAVFVNDRFPTEYYIQLIYSHELGQMLPVFTRRNERQIAKMEAVLDTISCDEKFVPYYIHANNLFLEYIRQKDSVYINRILSLYDEAKQLCPKRKNDFLTLIGMIEYHSGNLDEAAKAFNTVVENDDMNSIAHFYLKNIYSQMKDTTGTIYHLRKLKSYSPFSIPQLIAE